MNAPGWPPTITRVPYGTTHDELAPFLRGLAPAAPSTSDSVNSIEDSIGETPIFGRKNEIDRVVTAALNGRPCLITGAPGIGKSKVALAAAYDPRIVAKFKQRRVLWS